MKDLILSAGLIALGLTMLAGVAASVLWFFFAGVAFTVRIWTFAWNFVGGMFS